MTTIDADLQCTVVFTRIWDAINATNEDGSRKYRYIVLRGSSRSSKTRSTLQTYYLYAFGNEGKRLSVWRDTAKDCRDTVGYDMSVVYPNMKNYHLVSFHQTKFTFKFPGNTIIEINGTDEPNKVHGYQGDVAWLNEPYAISRSTFDQLDMRTSDFIIIDWNPKQGHWIDDLLKDPRTIEIHSTFRDNPFCPEEQRIKILSYQSVKYCSIVVGKLINEQGAKAYDILSNPLNLTAKQLKELSRCRENEDKRSANDFNWNVYGLGLKSERPNRIFHWDEIPYEEYKRIEAKVYYGVDWGAVDPWGILEAKYYDNCLYLHELNYTSENELRRKLTVTELAQINAADEGIVTWMFNKLGIDKSSDIICDDNRPLKISALRRSSWPRSFAAIKRKGSVNDGIDLLSNLTVYFTSCSENLKYEQENYSREVDRYGIVLEEPEDLNNHLTDPARYIAQWLKRLGIIKRV